jgi:hypothetical protein
MLRTRAVQDTNLFITPEELETILNTDFFVKKESALLKISDCFAGLRDRLSQLAGQNKAFFPPGAVETVGKISRGERYCSLPYLVLDYPAVFARGGSFAFRTIFLWGRYFSFTVLISGEYYSKYRSRLPAINLLSGKDFYLFTGADPYEHHFEEGNYQPVDKPALQADSFKNRDFFKLARKLDLERSGEMQEYGVETYRLFLEAMNR